MFGRGRRMARRTSRRTARRTTRRQMAMQDSYGEPEYYDDEPQAAAPAEKDITSQLEELAKLKDQGILTEEEFQAKKKQILDL
jgi:hypothetical protein